LIFYEKSSALPLLGGLRFGESGGGGGSGSRALGGSKFAGMEKKPPEGFGSGEDAVKNRLEGLGYI